MTLLEYINSEDRGFFLPDMGTNGLFLTGLTAYEVYENPENQLKVAKKMNQVLESDFIYSMSDGALFCETLGLELLKPDFDFPSVLSHPVVDLESLRKLEVPDPYSSGRMPTTLKTFNLVSKSIDKPFYVSIQGPFTLAVQLAGATHLLRSIIKDPEFVSELLDFTTEVVRRYSKATDEAGASYISIAEPGSITLSPERFEKLVVPNLNKVYNELNCWKSIHICGDTSDIIDHMLKCNIDSISLDQIMSYETVMKKIPKEIVLLGNLDPIELLEDGTPEEIRLETIKLLKKMRPYDNYMGAFGCNCQNETSIENLKTAVDTVRMSYNELDKIEV